MHDSNYMRLAFTDLDALPVVDRRDFLKLMGAGIVIFICLGDLHGAQDPGRRRRFGRRVPEDFNAFLRIDEDGTVTCFTGKVEMGQGIWTSLAQMLADELDTPLESIQMVMGDTDLCPWDMGTFGSMTTRFFGPSLRKAGAEARMVLLELAADRLEVPVDRLRVRGGVVFDEADERKRVSFGELAKGERIQRIVGREAVLKSIADFTVVGQPTVSTEARDKVTGKALYAGDIRLPGMRYASVLRPPAHGATLKEVDPNAVEQTAGARVVRDGELIAVLHETQDGAREALGRITARFDVPDPEVDNQNLAEHLVETAPRESVIDADGNVATGEQRASSVVEGVYTNGYVAHGTMETHTAVASIEGDTATVWASTQTPFSAREAVARAIGLPPENVRVITPYLGGGFGGKGQNPQVVEAARLAKLAGAPVHLEWTRAEEFFYDSFMPAAVVKVRSGVTDTGKIASWTYAVYHAGPRGAQLFYDVPHRRIVMHGAGWRATRGPHPFNTGAWRAPGANTNVFARESQIDMMAAAAGVDPLEFRLRNLKDQRMRQVLEATAEKFGWKPAKTPSGRGVGIACSTDSGTYVVHIAEVTVDKRTGHVQVQRVVCGQDMGLVINPRGATMQIEGCITMGLGYALSEEIRFNGGEVRDRNFDTYQMPRFSWVPKIETVLVDTGITEPHGGGEPAIVGMGGVIANAIHDAIGVRLFQLPMTAPRVKEALQRA